MTPLDALPGWAALLAGVLVLVGALFACIGALGLLRLGNFHQRVHAPTLGTTLGLYCVLAGVIVFSSFADGHLVLSAVLIGAFVTVTTPITLILLLHAAAARGEAGARPRQPAGNAASDVDDRDPEYR